MSKLHWVLGGSFICVCCVLPSYEGSDTNPRGGESGRSGSAGRGSGGQSGSAGQAGSSAVPQGGSPDGSGGEAGATTGQAGAEQGGAAGEAGVGNGGAPGEAGVGNGGTPTEAGTSNGGGGSASGGTGATGGGGPEGPCPGSVVGHCDRGAVYPSYAGYTLALVEDFPVALDLENDPVFTWSDSAPPDMQSSSRKEQLSFKDGKLVITAAKPAGCTAATNDCLPPRTSYAEALSPNKTAAVNARGVWSGELRSRYNNYRYGRYEVKMAAPVANPGQQNDDSMSGNFLAVMNVYRTPRNLQWAEIDVLLEANQHAKLNTNVISATGAVGYPSNHAWPGTYAPATGYSIYDEHVYAFEWMPTAVNWYLDGVLVRTQSSTAEVPTPTVSAKIMLSLWVFASAAAFGNPSLNEYPFSATYDYFRFYRLNTDTTYPCTPAPSCLPAADKTSSSQNNPNETNYGQ